MIAAVAVNQKWELTLGLNEIKQNKKKSSHSTVKNIPLS